MRERRLLGASDVLGLPNPSWLADFIIPERSLSMLWGPPNVGKSFVTLDLACSVATAFDWLGRAVEPGHVVYVAGEGVHSFKRRIGAWLEHNQATADALANLHFVPWPIQLHETVQPFLHVIGDIDPTLIIIDTWAASTLGAVENTSEGVGPALKALLDMRHDLKTSVMVVHHTGWNTEHERGSTTLRGAMDTSIEMTGERMRQGKYDDAWRTNYKNLNRTLVCHKQRDAERFRDLEIELREVRWKEPRKGGPLALRSLVPVLV